MDSSTNTKKSGSVRQILPENKLSFCGNFIPFISKSFFYFFFYLRLLLFISFPQEFRISKNFKHPTLEIRGQKDVSQKWTDGRTHGRTFWLIERIGPDGRIFEKRIIATIYICWQKQCDILDKFCPRNTNFTWLLVAWSHIFATLQLSNMLLV